MSKAWIQMAEVVANEKGVTQDMVLRAMESALAVLLRKQHGGGQFAVKLNTSTGEGVANRVWSVVESISDPDLEVGVFDLDEPVVNGKKAPRLQAGATFEESVEMPDLSRTGAQVFKQVLYQQLREMQRKRSAEQWVNRVGEVIIAEVKRIEGRKIYVDLGEPNEGILEARDLIGRERFRVGQRLRAMVAQVDASLKGPPVRLSRSHPDFLRGLMKIEIPEIGDGQIVVKAVARDPGQRAKVAIEPQPHFRGDAIGACIGMRGARIQHVVDELAGERVDIVMWSEEPARLLIAALAPGDIGRLILDPDKRTALVGADAQNMAKAIGKGGQNIRLASLLTGFKIDIMSNDELNARLNDESRVIVDLFKQALDVEDDIAEVLAENGFSTVDEIAYVPLSELLAIEVFDEEIIEELRNRAKDYLLNQALSATEEETENSLEAVEGMTEELAQTLREKDIADREALAELATDELVELVGIAQEEAGKLILEARKVWFETAE